MSISEDVYFNQLFMEYSGMLTEKQKEIFDMYYGLDLSLGEIAEINGISRQSVSDCIAKCKAQLLNYEDKLKNLDKKRRVLEIAEELDETAKEKIKKIFGEN